MCILQKPMYYKCEQFQIPTVLFLLRTIFILIRNLSRNTGIEDEVVFASTFQNGRERTRRQPMLGNFQYFPSCR